MLVSCLRLNITTPQEPTLEIRSLSTAGREGALLWINYAANPKGIRLKNFFPVIFRKEVYV